MTGATRFDETHGSTNRSTTAQEIIRDLQPIALRTASSSDEGKSGIKDKEESPELLQRRSRTETVRQDARKLKSATLNRMGRMFKQRSQTPVADKSSLNAEGKMVSLRSIKTQNTMKSTENCEDEASKKEKSNSLGRMFKLVDKDGSPKKLFHPRAGSLSRILRRHPNNDNNDNEKKVTEDNTPGIFSRMLSQLRGRPHSGNALAEPNIKSRNKMSSLPPKVPLNSRTTNLSSSTSVSSTQSQTTASPQKLSAFEYSI
ncbi:uncharacterized protein LOC114876122 [Osmia bicornis bicornis]|uniref:uncharacterized protein LOC114876122 n=1 Tax=Osmia bicornis bicornis TaxID=1437191 RepID=UPI001EAEC65E|nr:uncharacterized protein LOC114876122 [Osmia bicornis bicornis]